MRQKWWGIVLAAATFGLCLTVGRQIQTRHDFFVPLATSFLYGKLYVPYMRGELHEMVSQTEIVSGNFREPIDGVSDRYYVIYPPLPAILAIQFVLIGGSEINQSVISWVYFALSVWVLWELLGTLMLGIRPRAWLIAFYVLGSTAWYHALVGSAWYYAHVVALLTTFLTLYSVLAKKSAWLTGIFVGLMYLARYNLILTVPFFMLSLWSGREGRGRRLGQFLIPVLASLLLVGGYNYIRYGRVDHYGYTILESRDYNVTNEYRYGSYAWLYAPRHIVAALWSFPHLSPQSPYVTPNMMSMALWIVTPGLLIALWAPRQERLTRLVSVALLCLLPGTLFHGGIGASQFGYRYMLDYLPFLLILMALAMRERVRWWQQLLIVLSVLVNVWGVTTLM